MVSGRERSYGENYTASQEHPAVVRPHHHRLRRGQGGDPALRPGGVGAEPTATAGSKAERKDRVVVYYLHATFRCVTCNTIEKMTRSVLETRFSDALSDGRIEWRVADFQQEEALAKRYEIVSSGVLVVNIRDGKETGFRRYTFFAFRKLRPYRTKSLYSLDQAR